MSELAGKRVLVTGANTGIGRATVLAFARAGARVAAAWFEAPELTDSLIAEAQGFGATLVTARADLTREPEVLALYAAVLPALGGLDVVVNNAGVLLEKPLLLTTAADFDRVMGVNLRGTFLVGREALKDLAVERVKVDDFAFVRNSITVEVEVHGRGFSGQDVPVVLKQEGKVVASKSVRFESSDDVKPVGFTFTPDQTGRFVYTVSVPVFPDEAVGDNNTRSFVLKVIRDRVRVLLVVGRPSWDERFLRGLLRQDANVDLVSFYILRTMSDDPGVVSQERELSLIPFPMEEIFDTKLDTFDVVIFQNFGYADPSLAITEYERNLERYVHEGGAVVMIGGDSVRRM